MIYFTVYAGVVQAPIFMIHWRRVIETVRAWSDAFDLFVLTCCHLSDHPSCFKRQHFHNSLRVSPFSVQLLIWDRPWTAISRLSASWAFTLHCAYWYFKHRLNANQMHLHHLYTTIRPRLCCQMLRPAPYWISEVSSFRDDAARAVWTSTESSSPINVFFLAKPSRCVKSRGNAFIIVVGNYSCEDGSSSIKRVSSYTGRSCQHTHFMLFSSLTTRPRKIMLRVCLCFPLLYL